MKKYFSILLIVLAFACRKNDTISTPETVDDSETVVASVAGIVVNESDLPVSGATVTLGTNTAFTDAYGRFRFSGKSISKNNTHIKVEKANYFNGNRSLQATAGRTHNVRIKLQPKTITGTVNATSGGVVTMASGSKVTFAANVIVDANGAAYTGTVNVAMAYINPTSSDLGSLVQGDLRGVASTGGERILETYGMLGVELTTAAGVPLKIATGKTAEINSPIPSVLQTTAPTTIPLWHYDETKGRWIEEGTATKVGNNYVANVSHFSFWNYDIGANGVTLCVNVVSPNNQPLNNVTVRIRRVNNPASCSYGQTDSIGNVCGAVFKNEPLTLDILDRCGNVVYTQAIGPYSANASVNVIANIPSANYVTITGTVVNCSNAPVTSGSVVIYTSGGHQYNAAVNATGAFSLTILNCASSTINFTALPIDNTTQQQGNAYSGTITSGALAMGNLQACGTSTTQFISLLVDGTPYSWVTPVDSLGTYSGSIISPYSFATTIFGNRSPTGGTSANGNSITFGTAYNATVGSYPVTSGYISVSLNNAISSAQFGTGVFTNNLTTIGAVASGFLEGNFSGTATFQPGNVVRTVTCSYKVRRP